MTPDRAAGFRRISAGVVVESDRGQVVIARQDFPRLAAMMAEGSSREDRAAEGTFQTHKPEVQP